MNPSIYIAMLATLFLLIHSTIGEDINYIPPSAFRLRTIHRERSIKIARGKKASKGQFPFQVGFICERNGNDMFHFCGGSILTPNKVLTAGHCCQDFPKLANVRAVLGRNQIVSQSNPVDGATVDIDSFYQHEDYNDATLYADLCIVTLKQNVTLQAGSSMDAVLLPGVDDELAPESDAAFISGWGYVHTGTHPNDLYFDKVPVRNYTHCGLNSVERRYSICAGSNDGHDSCAGDSGGPLFYPRLIENQELPVIYGVVSWGVGSCGGYGSYGVYVRVSKYRPWILKHVPNAQLSNSNTPPSDIGVFSFKEILCSLSTTLLSTSILCF